MADKETVLVTGAGSGIRQTTAKKSLEQGGRVAFVNFSQQSLDADAADLKQYADDMITITADISNSADTDAMIKKTVDHFSKLNIAVNVAGINGLTRAAAIEFVRKSGLTRWPQVALTPI